MWLMKIGKVREIITFREIVNILFLYSFLFLLWMILMVFLSFMFRFKLFQVIYYLFTCIYVLLGTLLSLSIKSLTWLVDLVTDWFDSWMERGLLIVEERWFIVIMRKRVRAMLFMFFVWLFIFDLLIKHMFV